MGFRYVLKLQLAKMYDMRMQIKHTHDIYNIHIKGGHKFLSPVTCKPDQQ